VNGIGTGPFRVLIVDDDDDYREALRRLLGREGIREVLEAADGAEALGITRTERPDLVVLDLGMPDRSGIEVLPEMHQLLPDSPIVVLSNFPRRQMAEIVRRAGAVGYVEKRVGPERLVGEILIAASLAEHAAARMSSDFPAAAASAGKARRFVRHALDAPAEEVLDDIELMVSELVSNVVLHAGSPPRVDILLGRDSFRVEIYDDDPRLPELRHASPDAGGGRGILLIDRLASRWGAEAHGQGKVVWFERDRVSASP
jgi:CheY-like chemotaxis protein